MVGVEMTEWERLRELFPWPAARPGTRPFVHGWTTEERQWAGLLARVPAEAIVLEVGAWTGKTSLCVLNFAPRARLIAVDIWTESAPALEAFWPIWRAEKQVGPADTPKSLYQANLWEQRDRVVLVQADSVAGMLVVAFTGVLPDLVYIDAQHGEASVYRDVSVAVECFPGALISGHDYLLSSGSEDSPVARAVNRCGRERGLRVEHIGKVWWYER